MKRLFPTLIFICFLMIATASQASRVYAQETSLWGRFTGGIRSTFQRWYLMLPGEKSGEAVLNQAMMAMQNLKTARSTSVVKVTADTEQAPVSGEWTTEGVVDAEDIFDYTSFRQQMTFTGNAQAEGMTLSLSGDMVMDGQVVYLKFSELPTLPMFNTARAKGIWMKIDPTAMTATESSQVRMKTELTEEDQHQLRAAYEELWRSAETSAARKEELDGHPVFVVDMTFDSQDLTNYTERINSIMMEGEEQMTEEQKASMRNTIADLAPLTVTVSIDRNSYFLRRIVMPLTMSMSELSDGQQTGSIVVNVDMKYTDHNQPVVIDVPEDAQDVNQVMNEVLPTADSMGSAAEMQAIQELLKDNDGKLPVELEGLSPEEKKVLREMGLGL